MGAEEKQHRQSGKIYSNPKAAANSNLSVDYVVTATFQFQAWRIPKIETLYTTKKTFYYNFLCNKEEEDICKARRITPVPWNGCSLVIVRDTFPPPVLDPLKPWKIKRIADPGEIASGKLMLSFHVVIEHVFRYWDFRAADCVAVGNKVCVPLLDVTGDRPPKRYQTMNIYLEMYHGGHFCFTCLEWMRDVNLMALDEIHMYWDSKVESFRIRKAW